MTSKLDELGKTIIPGRGITSVVLAQYEKILAARQMLWDWKAIADAMDMTDKAAQIRQAFLRLTEGLKNHEVALPKKSMAIDTSGKIPARTPARTPARAETEVKTAARTTGDVDWEALARKNKGDEADIQWKG